MRTQAFNAFRGVSLSLLLCPLSLFPRNLVAGEVVSWGSNRYGQTNAPPDLTNVIAVAAGATHSLALRADSTVAAWGDGTYGQILVPLGLTNVVAVAAGDLHSLALKSDGTVVAWGAGTANSGTWPDLGQSLVPLS